MEPTLCPGDRLLVNLWDPDLDDLARGDLVALEPGRSEVPVVKRVVGLPGDRVAIRDALLYGPVVVPADRFLVLGDARASSIDSRSYGPVPADRLLGTVALRVPAGDC
jgi:signal peptidase I